MFNLIIAVKSYQTEYNRLPNISLSDTELLESRGALFTILFAEDSISNPREIKFYDDFPYENGHAGIVKNAASEWELRDPWGNLYHLYLDADGDGKIPNPARTTSDDEPETLSTSILVFSAGPDGDFTTWKDNIRSWE